MSFNQWREVKIEQIADKLAMGPFGSNIKSDNFVKCGVPIIRGGNLSIGRFNDQDFVYLTEEKADELIGSNVFVDDIVFTHRGTLGQVGIIPRSKYKRYVISQSQMKMTCNKELSEPYFIYYFFKSTIGQYKLLSNTSTTGVPAIARPLTSLKSILISLPPLIEQKAIADTLICLDDKIELNNRISKTLEEMAQAIFKSWFVDFEPFQDEKLDGLPSGWKFYVLGDVSEMSAGGDKPQVFSKTSTEICRIPIYSNGIDNYGLYGYTDTAKITTESVTVSARGTIGFTCLRQVPYVPIVRLVSLVPNAKFLSSKYLYLWLKNSNISGTGTTQQQLTIPDFKKTSILIPTKDVMEHFTSIVTPLFAQMAANRLESEKFAEIRDSLLPKLMSGEIRVPIQEVQ